MSKAPTLSDDEWATFESFIGHPITGRAYAATAFWERTYANDRQLTGTFIRLAWIGDRVLNLALADRAEGGVAPTRFSSLRDPSRRSFVCCAFTFAPCSISARATSSVSTYSVSSCGGRPFPMLGRRM